MNERTCIVSRKSAKPDELIRFVAGPDQSVVADLRRNLPGRGCWVTADRRHVELAISRKLFSRALRTDIKVSPELGELVDALMVKSALGALGLARKAGMLVLGAAKVEASVRNGSAAGVIHAREASVDGIRKITQARRAVVHLGGEATPAYKLFSEHELGLALGGTNVIHAAILAGDAGKSALKRMAALDRYRNGSPDEEAMLAAVAEDLNAAEDTE